MAAAQRWGDDKLVDRQMQSSQSKANRDILIEEGGWKNSLADMIDRVAIEGMKERWRRERDVIKREDDKGVLETANKRADANYERGIEDIIDKEGRAEKRGIAKEGRTVKTDVYKQKLKTYDKQMAALAEQAADLGIVKGSPQYDTMKAKWDYYIEQKKEATIQFEGGDKALLAYRRERETASGVPSDAPIMPEGSLTKSPEVESKFNPSAVWEKAKGNLGFSDDENNKQDGGGW